MSRPKASKILMRKGIKILGKVLSWIVIAIVCLPLLAALALNIGAVQNFAVHKATEYLSRKLETTVSIERLRLRGFSKLTAEGIYIEDYGGDTLLFAKRLAANVSKSALLRKKIIIGDVLLDRAKIYLYTPTDGVLNIAELIGKFGSDTTKTKKGTTRIALRNLRVADSRFKFQREGADTLSSGMNFGNMVFDGLNISAPSLNIDGGAIGMRLKSVSFRDISGFTVNELAAAHLTVDNGTIALEDAQIITPHSDIHMPVMSMKGESWQSLSHIMDSVRFDLDLTRSTISTRTLAYFIRSLPQNRGVALHDVEVSFGGAINDFDAKLSMTAGDDAADVKIRAAVKGVADIPNAVFDVGIERFETSGEALLSIASELTDSLPKRSGEILGRTGAVSLTGAVAGRTEKFTADVHLTADAGEITLAGKGGMLPTGEIDFGGTAKVAGLDAGILLDNKLLGKVTIDAKASGRAAKENFAVSGSVYIPNAEFNGYTYSGITVAGSYDNRKVDANLKSTDPELLLSVNGSADMSGNVPVYKANVNLGHINLHLLNLNTKDSVAILSGRILAAGSGSELDNINGQVTVTDLRYTSSTDNVAADTILITARSDEYSKYLGLNSSYADVEFRSGMSYKDIMSYLSHILYDYLPALDPTGHSLANHRKDGTALPSEPLAEPADGKTHTDDPAEAVSNISELHIDIKQANNIAAIFLPGFSIAEDTRADAVFDAVTETFLVTANSDYIEYSGFFVTRLDLRADNTTEPGAVTLDFTTEDLYLPGFSLPSNSLRARIADDRIALQARISNSTTDLNASIDIESVLSRPQDKKSLNIGVLFEDSSYITAAQQQWNLSSDMIEYTPGRVAINDLLVRNGSQRLMLDGIISPLKSDTLRLTLDRFDLSALNTLLGIKNATVGGILDGGAELISGMKDPVLIADINMDSLRINDFVSAPLRLSSAWDFATERAGLTLKNVATGKNLIRGFYRPDAKTYFATIDIDKVPLAIADPFLPADIIKSTDGSAAVYLEVSGSKGLPKMNGTVSVSDFAATIGITNVTYSAKTLDIDIDGSVINLPETVLTDNEGNTATLSAGADIANTANITYHAHLVPSNIMAINTSVSDNNQFYGKIYISGALNVTGNRNGVNADVAITTQPNSAFYLSLAGKSSVSEADWITFQSRVPDEHSPESTFEHKKQMYENSLRELSRKSEGVNMNLNVSLNINPGLLLSIIIDQTNNMVLNARGSAALDVMLNPGTGELSTFGTYEISEGDFLFSLQPLVSNRKFTLQRGSSIQLSGNPMDALLNIEAVYRLRASLQPIAALQGTGINTNTRVPVDCIVHISESLAKPDVTFDIRIPSADADIQNVLSGALSSDTDRALNFLWLVGFSSFAPNGASDAGTNASSAGTGLGLDFLTNQLTNMISTKDLSLTFRYRPQQDKDSYNEVDFGFSYNVGGNDRLILEVEGNYNDYEATNMRNNANITGDASITWIITPSGNLSLKGFTQTINRYDENQGLQENGVGIYYKEDFNVFSDIITQQRERREARRRKRAEKEAARNARKEQRQAEPQIPSMQSDPADPASVTGGSPVEAKSRIEQRRENSERQRRRRLEERRMRENDALESEEDAKATDDEEV